jgi:hypothetical protein
MANDKRWCFAWFHRKADVASSTRPACGVRERGAVITVMFLDGDEGLMTRVRDSGWQRVSPDPANLQFAFVDPAHADVRIDVRPGNGSWSNASTSR